MGCFSFEKIRRHNECGIPRIGGPSARNDQTSFNKDLGKRPLWCKVIFQIAPLRNTFRVPHRKANPCLFVQIFLRLVTDDSYPSQTNHTILSHNNERGRQGHLYQLRSERIDRLGSAQRNKTTVSQTTHSLLAVSLPNLFLFHIPHRTLSREDSVRRSYDK